MGVGVVFWVGMLRLDGRKSDYDSLRLHRAESLEVYVVDSLVLQLDVCLGFETFVVHGRFYLIWIKDEQATFSPPLHYESVVFLVQTTFVVEADLNALLHDLANRDHVLCYGGHVQDIPDASLFAFFPEWDIADVLNAMCDVISRCRHVSST